MGYTYSPSASWTSCWCEGPLSNRGMWSGGCLEPVPIKFYKCQVHPTKCKRATADQSVMWMHPCLQDVSSALGAVVFGNIVSHPVDFGCPALPQRLVKFLTELFQRLLVCFAQCQGILWGGDHRSQR